jgi:glycosyltransferase involved in cell wall biosynthesis
VLLEALVLCRRAGLRLDLRLAGDGAHRGMLNRRARELGLDGCVIFLGHLRHGPAVFQFLDTTDLFILPSRQEGLPRAMLEAMARGCPCIGTTVGGIPELLPPEDLVPPNDPRALADKILAVARDHERMARMSRRNWQKAQEYRPEILDAKRREFYQAVLRISEKAS